MSPSMPVLNQHRSEKLGLLYIQKINFVQQKKTIFLKINLALKITFYYSNLRLVRNRYLAKFVSKNVQKSNFVKLGFRIYRLIY